MIEAITAIRRLIELLRPGNCDLTILQKQTLIRETNYPETIINENVCNIISRTLPMQLSGYFSPLFVNNNFVVVLNR